MSEKVNHPTHYNAHPSGIECIDVVEHFNFNIGNAIKYAWRAGLKSPTAEEDLKKAEWYIRRELERLGRDPIREKEIREKIRDFLHNIHKEQVPL